MNHKSNWYIHIQSYSYSHERQWESTRWNVCIAFLKCILHYFTSFQVGFVPMAYHPIRIYLYHSLSVSFGFPSSAIPRRPSILWIWPGLLPSLKAQLDFCLVALGHGAAQCLHPPSGLTKNVFHDRSRMYALHNSAHTRVLENTWAYLNNFTLFHHWRN